MTPYRITLGEQPLNFELLDAILDRPLSITLSESGLARVRRARQLVEELTRGSDAIYGINTGFGHLKNVRISADQLDKLQENLLISHAVGLGPPAPPGIVRWMMLFKIHMLLQGHSGVRVETLGRLVDWLNLDLLPVVPTRGSLGASGDLAPLAHLFLPLLGHGEMCRGPDGAVRPAGDQQREFGLAPLRLVAKEGLALINGTQFMASYGAHVAVRALRLADLADLILCMSLEGLRGSIRPADERLHRLRPHPGALVVAANIRRHLAGSEILESHEECEKVQDPYSLRCAPQVHGAFRDALAHVCEVLAREINSVTDNPILFGDDQPDPALEAAAPRLPAEAVSGGAFHGEPLALAMDYLAMALTEMANISERRVYLLLAGEDGLPKLLMRDTGLNSGFMLPQYVAAALLNECKVLSTPACVDSIPTSLGQEDHVSMGGTSAIKLYEIVDRVEHVLAIEMMCAAQAMDFRDPLRPGAGPGRARDLLRKSVPHAEEDRPFGQDIRAALRLLRESTELLRVARA